MIFLQLMKNKNTDSQNLQALKSLSF